MSLKHNISPCHQHRLCGETATHLDITLWETWSYGYQTPMKDYIIGASISWNDVSVPG